MREIWRENDGKRRNENDNIYCCKALPQFKLYAFSLLASCQYGQGVTGIYEAQTLHMRNSFFKIFPINVIYFFLYGIACLLNNVYMWVQWVYFKK